MGTEINHAGQVEVHSQSGKEKQTRNGVMDMNSGAHDAGKLRVQFGLIINYSKLGYFPIEYI